MIVINYQQQQRRYVYCINKMPVSVKISFINMKAIFICVIEFHKNIVKSKYKKEHTRTSVYTHYHITCY